MSYDTGENDNFVVSGKSFLYSKQTASMHTLRAAKSLSNHLQGCFSMGHDFLKAILLLHGKVTL